MTIQLKFKVDTATRIKKPIEQVFEAVVAPDHLNKYFTNGAKGRLEPGSNVQWKFAELPNALTIDVVEVTKNKRIEFKWEAHKVSYKTKVEVLFENLDEKGTMVRVIETGWETDSTGLESMSSHTEGWVHMLCCLKGYLEYSIDLRSGSGACNQN